MKTNFHHVNNTPLIAQHPNLVKKNVAKNTSQPFSQSLNQVLQEKQGLTISKHANTRMQQRGISISDETWDRVNEKTQQAKRKGVNDSLVLLTNAALIVSAKNNVVVTAMGREEAAGQIFTNINGTIVID
ncbi:TIGR02530 family flagellar biosynthesis protein [Bacillus sp. 1P06AnD]|uniref:TIGR02530 family flagellar biosynthesis protein n=1 Tax=Bacillus sp. 1P06AnD TaxID=3132208 RepID=UPI0039A38C22